MAEYARAPVGIGALARLKSLVLSFNELSALPAGLGRLHNLEELDLDECPGLAALEAGGPFAEEPCKSGRACRRCWLTCCEGPPSRRCRWPCVRACIIGGSSVVDTLAYILPHRVWMSHVNISVYR